MRSYIDKDEAIDALCKDGCRRERMGRFILSVHEAKQLFVDILENIPVADAAEVVRCKECKYWKMIYLHYGECLCKNAPVEIGESLFPKDDFYCAYGERKSEDNGI